MEPQWYGTRPPLTRRLRVALLFICSTAEAGRMRAFLAALILATGVALEFDVQAQTSNSVTATCKDGSSFSGSSRRGACAGHGGVQAWGVGTPSPAATPPAPAPASPGPAITPTRPSTAPTAQGGAGQVWVNTNSKVYHCAGDRYYGKTKQGEYMSEADARAKGYHPDHNKSCS
jgi:hypothetical protein